MEYNCPLCKCELKTAIGDQTNPGNSDYGVTLYCSSRECPAQEVMGHGKNEKTAFEIIQAKYNPNKKQ